METMTIQAPVTFTSGALRELKRLMDAPDFDATNFIRVGVKGGGCSGLSYVLGFDKQEADDDLFEFEGIQAIMKKAHGLYLAGMEIDFSEGLNARGFVFNNPNASSSCGCGTSFAV
ncbi:iron-sulfur cluster assembly accessory protein [Taibaiella sp. KBW10]|uniref:HesB/IscA family protein n=1 Tax=Taibaiella sp. KBW10 TaxID=2153357 RepID=UPI000F594C49|nr:iron-sulfur cluster assembly accessory protein [Taibaiella sp. KBW10]RQO32013.1 iron-sulfur cluster assembly accessory protein [Taibaiella sp. KBW10]